MNPTTYTPGQQMAPTPPTGGGSVLSGIERFLPTIGSIALPLAGAALAPETGGLSLLAEAGLAGAGGALGKGVQDIASGQPLNPTGIAENAALGAAGQGIGEGVTSAVGALGGKLATAGAAADAAQTAAKEATNLGNEFGGALSSGDEQAARGLGSSVQLAKSLGVDTTQSGTAQSMQDLSDQALGLYGGAKKAILTNAGPVDMSGMDQVLQDAVEKNIGPSGAGSSVIAPGTPAYRALESDLQSKLVGKTAGSATEDITGETAVDPETAFNYVSGLGKQVGAAKQALATQTRNALTGVPDTGLQQNLQLARDVYNGAKNLLYNRPEVQAALDAFKATGSGEGGLITPGDIAATTGDDAGTQTGANITPVDPESPLAQKVADDFNSMTTPQDLLDQESKFVNMNQVARDATHFNQEAVAGPAAAKRAAQLAMENTPLTAGVGNLADLTHPAGIIKTALNVAKGGSPAADKVGAGVLNTLTKTMGKGNATNLVGLLSQLGAHTPTYAGTPVGDTMQGGTTMNPYQTQGTSNPNIMQEIVQAGILDPAAVPALQGSLKAEQAQPLLQGLESQYGQAGGAQGMGGGLLSQLSSYIPGTAAWQYHQQMGALAQQIAQVTGQSPQAIEAMLPSLMASQSGAQNEFGNLQSSINQGVPGANLQANFNNVPSASVLGGL